MVWAHTFNVEEQEFCDDCGKELELRLIGKTQWVYFCTNCLKHNIKSKDAPKDEDRK